MADLYRKSAIEKLSNPEQLDRRIRVSSPFSWLALIGAAIVVAAIILWLVFGTVPVTQTVSGILADKSDTGAVYADKTGVVTEILKRPGDKLKEGDVLAKLRSADGKQLSVVCRENGVLTDLLIRKDRKIYAGGEAARFTPDLPEDRVLVCYVPAVQAAQLKKGMAAQVYPETVNVQKHGHMEATVLSVGAYPASEKNLRYVLGENNRSAEPFLSEGPVVAVLCRLRTDKDSKNGCYWTKESGASLALPERTPVKAEIFLRRETPFAGLFGFGAEEEPAS